MNKLTEMINQTTDNFIKDYNGKIDKILHEKDKISGTHEIDYKKAELFINSQLNEKRRRAAKNLIDNTYYFTFNFIFEKVRDLVIEIYNNTNEIVIFTGSKKSSHYFISLIAYYYIKLLNYKIPFFIQTIEEFEIINYNENMRIVIFDDCIYSGGQMYVLMCELKDYADRIIIASVIITDWGIDTIKYELDNSKINQPKIIYSKLVEKFHGKLPRNEFLELMYYFNPYNKTCPCSIYLDYKMADFTSTPITALLYGPILPAKLNLDYSLISNTIFNDRELRNLKYGDNIQEDKNIDFIPFIKGCDNIPEEFYNMPYGSILKSRDDLYENDLYKDILKKVYDKDIRCPTPIYKNLI